MTVIEDLTLRNKLHIFKDRKHAGYALSKFLEEKLKEKENLIVLAIPRGGVPIGYILAKELRAEFDLIVVRKIPVPWNPEAGFGAITPDGEIFLDDEVVVKYLGLKTEEVKNLAKKVLEGIKRREKLFLGNRERVDVTNKNVVLVDDGLATGFTMLAAVKFLKDKPRKIMVAVPTASRRAVLLLTKHVHAIYCLNIRSELPYFAVADAYVNWRDLTDDDVIQYLKNIITFNCHTKHKFTYLQPYYP